MSKREYYVVYEYGQGGRWAILKANNVKEIHAAYPFLKVFESRPKWMTREIEDQIKQDYAYDIEDPPSGVLAYALAMEIRKKEQKS